MADFLRRHSLSLVTIFLLVTAFQLMGASTRNQQLAQFGGQLVASALHPLERANYTLLASFRSIWDRYIWLVNVGAEQQELTSRIQLLEEENSRLLEFEQENKQLRNLLEFQTTAGTSKIAATIVARDPSNWVRTATINRGREAGVRPGMPVVDGHAVVGQTTVVSSKTAIVLLLTDSTSAIDAVVQSSRAPGIVEGMGGETLRMRYVMKEYVVTPGDRVISSGLDGVYPKGKLIGVVTAVNPDASGLFQSIELEPSADFHRLEQVLVLGTARASQASENPSAAAVAEDSLEVKPVIIN